MTLSAAQISPFSCGFTRLRLKTPVSLFEKPVLTWENEDGPGGVGSTDRGLTQQPDSSRRWDGFEAYPERRRPRRLQVGIHPMSAVGARKLCPIPLKHQLIKDQEGLCAYCLIPFGSVIQNGRRYRLSVVHFDHVIPFAYTNNNPPSNWAAACNFCNSIKGAKKFDSMHEIREFVLIRWIQKRMFVAWEAPVSSELDPYRWAVKFGTFLAGLPPKLAGSIAYVKPYTRAKKPAVSKTIYPVDEHEESA